jgi:hypothetical protein
MKSHEVLKKVIQGVGTKQVAHDMRVSNSLVYKWCADPGEETDLEASGARNPLDRILELVDSTGDREPILWLCEQVSGHYVENPEIEDQDLSTECLRHTQELLSKFSDLLQVISISIGREGRIDEEEAAEIRTSWQQLQRRAEGFVRGCEKGTFDDTR